MDGRQFKFAYRQHSLISDEPVAIEKMKGKRLLEDSKESTQVWCCGRRSRSGHDFTLKYHVGSTVSYVSLRQRQVNFDEGQSIHDEEG
ncbi:hypothetical protein [Sinorhizobium americanum]|nr:hypothetical protein [Sinorhizobium americanum]